MTANNNDGAPDDLNFDRAESSAGQANTRQCSNCGKPLGASYYSANGSPICASCRGKLQAAVAPVSGVGTVSKALLFGFGAAIVGAIIYYAVMRFLNLEIGLVAILTGWLVGQAMRRATDGKGGRLLQVVAAVLVYVSVAMAYAPFAMGDVMARVEAEADSAARVIPGIAPEDTASLAVVSLDTAPTLDSAALPTEDTVAAAVGLDLEQYSGAKPDIGFFQFAIALVVVFALALTLPILVIFGSGAGGIISAAIIGFGMAQAWQLMAAPKIVFEGPFKLADENPPST